MFVGFLFLFKCWTFAFIFFLKPAVLQHSLFFLFFFLMELKTASGKAAKGHDKVLNVPFIFLFRKWLICLEQSL